MSVRNRFGMSDPSPYAVAHRSNFADDMAAEDPFLPPGISFDLSTSTRYILFFRFCTISLFLPTSEQSQKCLLLHEYA